jgi:D-3-phosphoglycerate dehydrogenase / 2-oxoglutarate reductase
MSKFVVSGKSGVEKRKILLLEGIHPGAKTALERSGFSVELEKSAFQGRELVTRASGFHGLGIRSKTQLTAEVLTGLPQLEVIGTFCIGTDQVDLRAANRSGIPVFNAPYSNTRSVAELVLAEMISLSRRLTDRSMQMHRGVWQKSAAGANEVRGRTLGIVGYGHIGSQLSVLAEALGVHVLFFDIVKKLPLGNARVCGSLGELLEHSDFVSLHVPDTDLTRNMMGAPELRRMKKGAYLINASRGMVVDLPALAEALRSKHLGGAAVDVYPAEPDGNSEGFVTPLQEIENVILTPHIGGSTEEAQAAIGLEVAESFRRFFQTGTTSGAVNFPWIDVGEVRVGRRVLNVHKNVPGVLGAVNGIISEEGGNIVAQHLKTDENIGYLIVDIDSPRTAPVAEKISRLATSIVTVAL